MERAGCAIADSICARYAPRPTLVLCGSGNNGGDGYVVARLLKERGWPVSVARISDHPPCPDTISARAAWINAGGTHMMFSPQMLEHCTLCVDAMFGVGLTRAPEGLAAEAIAALAKRGIPVVAVDMPSGVASDTGAVLGNAINATLTVTLFRAKPGLFLLPGKTHAGDVVVADIGIPDSLLSEIAPRYALNMPALWRNTFPTLTTATHKYTRGHALVMGGGMASSGAAKLAAMAALKVGAGLVSIGCVPEALPVYGATLLSIMTKPVQDDVAFSTLISDTHITALLVGPGNGVNYITRARALAALSTRKPCVVDADALSVFADDPTQLFSALHAQAVLTPHEGEFARLFNVRGSKMERALASAKQAGCVVLLKGSDTIIAHPDGRAVINANAPPWLATAGTGDVLAGLITGLMAQKMHTFDAACAATWLHGEAANQLGRGLIAEELPSAVGALLKSV